MRDILGAEAVREMIDELPSAIRDLAVLLLVGAAVIVWFAIF